MLPAANRLRRAADFTDTNRRGHRSACGHVVASVALGPTGSTAPARVGLVVGRRVGGSVVRHRVARRLRAAARAVLTDLPDGSTVVLRALPGAGTDPGLPVDAASAIRAALGAAVRRAAR